MIPSQSDLDSLNRQAFARSFRNFRKWTIVGSLSAAFSCFAIMFVLFPAAPLFRQFYRTNVGGDIGEILIGISIPLISSPPAIIFIAWYLRSSKDPAFTCSECGCWLATAENFKSVVETSKCPNCNAEQFRRVNS